MPWKMQFLLWKFLPDDRAVKLSLYVFGCLLALALVVFVVGRFLKRRWLSRGAAAMAALVLLIWGLLFVTQAEISNGSDVLRAFWHEHFGRSWTLPIVLVAVPITP